MLHSRIQFNCSSSAFLNIYTLMTWKEINWHCHCVPSLPPFPLLPQGDSSICTSLVLPMPLSAVTMVQILESDSPLLFLNCHNLTCFLSRPELCPSIKALYCCFIHVWVWTRELVVCLKGGLYKKHLIKNNNIHCLLLYSLALHHTWFYSIYIFISQAWGVSLYWLHFTTQHPYFNYPLLHPSLRLSKWREGGGGRKIKKRLRREYWGGWGRLRVNGWPVLGEERR